MNSTGSFNANANWIDATFAISSAKSFGFRLTQSKEGNSATSITYNTETNELIVAPVNGEEIHPLKVMVKPVNGKIKLQILLDKSSLEVFANDGEKVMTTYVFPQAGATKFSLFAEGGTVKAESLRMYDFAK